MRRVDGISLGDFKRGDQRGVPAQGALSKFLDATPGLRRRVVLTLSALALANVVLIVTTFIVSQRYPALISPAILAYTFGLRHAVDADHLAAIDNMTRRLMAGGQRPVTVGLYFSLGHSTIVFILSIGVAVATNYVKGNVAHFQVYGTIIGTTISAIFLLLIGLVNLWVLVGLVKRWRQLRDAAPSSPTREALLSDPSSLTSAAGTASSSRSSPRTAWALRQQKEAEERDSKRRAVDAAAQEDKIGFMNRLCPWVSKVVDTPWKMYPGAIGAHFPPLLGVFSIQATPLF